MIVDDEFLSLETQDRIEELLVGVNSDVPYVFSPATSNTKATGVLDFSESEESFQIVSLIHPPPPGMEKYTEEIRALVKSSLASFGDKHNFNVVDVFRIKSNLQAKNLWSERPTHSPHVDSLYTHWVWLYYVNDSDGDTVFYDKWFDAENPNPTDLTESLRVPPKKGRAVVFNGFQYHSSSSPTKSPFRSVINVNFMTENTNFLKKPHSSSD
jgi:hypothetical protein